MRHRDRQLNSFGITSPRAPWRRAARPLAILFSLQLSGIGCAARSPAVVAPTRPDEIAPILGVYEDQLGREGISLEEAEDYVTGRSASPLPVSVSSGAARTAASDATGTAASDAAVPQAEGPGGEPTYKLFGGVAEYLIGPGDVLGVTTYLGPESPTPSSHRVQADGSIYIARFNIGAVVAAGTTPSELTRTLSDLFRQYVPAGYAEVRVEEYNAWNATLTGEIRDTPNGGAGNYQIEGRITLSEFINSYGGPTANADLGDVRIVRRGNEQLVDLSAILAGGGADPTIHAGDVVHVPSIELGSSRLFIFGEVREPGVYTYTAGISVLDAIAQAGGYTQTAKQDAVFVSRPTTGEVIPVDLQTTLGGGQAAAAPLLEAGDFVVVPFSPDRSQKIRDWVGIASLVLSAITILQLTRN